MSDSPRSHRAPSSTTWMQRTDAGSQETTPVNRDANIPTSEQAHDPPFVDRTDSNYTTVPTSDAHSITSGEGTATRAPQNKKGQIKPREPTKRLAVLRLWLLEFLALLVSILSFAGIAALLGAYNAHPQLEFARDININTIIAILSTALRAAMAFIATEVIGQSKWEWLEEPRPLRHVERLENAGRGAWGSIRFLFFVSKPNFAVLGALLMITSYIIDPFSQQLVKTYPCNIPSDGKASITVARRISNYNSLGGPSMWVAGTTGLVYGVTENASNQLFQCPSGNCTFASNSGITHSSVGICSTCIDATVDLVEIDLGNHSTEYHFPQIRNLSLTWPPPEYESPYFHMRTDYRSEKKLRDSRSVSTSTTSIITFSAAACGNQSQTGSIFNETKCRRMNPEGLKHYAAWKKNTAIVALNCSLSPCLRRYSGEVSHGTLKEKLVSHEPMVFGTMDKTLEGLISWPWFLKFEPCVFNEKWYDLSNITEAPKDDSWIAWTNYDNSTHQAPRQCVVGFQAHISTFVADYQNATMQGHSHFFDRISDPWSASWAWLPTFTRMGNATFETMSAAFDGMAAGYTDFLRGNWQDIQNDRYDVVGTAYKSAVCIQADWLWLIYPGILLMFTTVLLVTAYLHSMREGGKRPVWKSTILPFLFYNLTMNRDQDRDYTNETGMEVPLLQLRELEKLADKTAARFSADAAAPRFVVEDSEICESMSTTRHRIDLFRGRFRARAD